MIGLFEEELTKELNKDGLNARKYFGELIDPKIFKFTQNELPLILVDYIGDEPSTLIRKKHSFNLYLTHISYSKNEKTRIKKHKELYEFLSEIDKKLSMKSFLNSEPIVMGKSEKIFDAITNTGYLTVYTKKVTVILNNY